MSKNSGQPISVILGAVILVVCAAWPVLDFGVRNMPDQDFKPARLFYYFLLFLGLGAALAFALKFLFRQSGLGLALFVAGACTFLTLNYYLIATQLQTIAGLGNYALIGVLLYALLLGSIVFLLAWRKTRPALPPLAIAIVFGLGGVAIYNSGVLGHHLLFTEAGKEALKGKSLRSDRWPTDARMLSENKHYTGDAQSKPPNIYYIVPDMFMGKNEFTNMTGLPYRMDEILEQRQFKVLDNYYSNAPITRLSLAHVFGGQYFAGQETTLTTASILALPWRTKSEVTPELRKRGYNIFYYVDSFVNPDCDSLADYCFKKKSFFDAQDLIFLERTPVLDMMAASGSDLSAVWRRLMTYPSRFEIPEILNALPKKGAGPYFTYMHFGLPHSPYRFNEKCEYYDAYPPIRENKFEGSVLAYGKHVQCAEVMYTRLVDQILKNDPDAWIVFQADHGVNYRGQSVGEDIMGLTPDAVGQNLSIIGAYRLPERCLETIPADMSPVNTFKILFACLDGTPPSGLLPAQHYLMYYISWQPSGQVRDVTEIIRGRAQQLN